MIDCGDCPAGQLCGGAGTPNVCGGDPTCVALTCDNAGGRFCGMIGDGCGKSLDCGACPGDQICGGAGAANVCGGGPSCVPRTCQQPTGKYCGQIGDGCGKTLDCGGCAAGDTCGGSGIPGVCGNPMGACTGLCMQQMMCPGGGSTVLTGTVVAPTPPQFGAPDPIYNAIVYVPNATVQPFQPGVTCTKCDADVTGSPLVHAFTGADGKFRLENVPVGNNIPLVIQLGRWRRQVVIPTVEACKETLLPTELTRLPRNKTEGDIPHMAIATGEVDLLQCVLRKVGIAESEFTLPTGNGRVHFYQDNGSSLGPGTPTLFNLTDDVATMTKYDMVILPCRGNHHTRSGAAQGRLVQYANMGGRVFTTHYSYSWLHDNAAWSGTADWEVRQDNPDDPLTGIIDQSFPKGMAFAQWLQIVGAQSGPGQISINDPRHNANAVVAPTLRWVYSNDPESVQQLTFNTPVGSPADAQCGRVLYSDFHVTDRAPGGNPVFPSECANTPLTPQEKVLEFMFFDLASCVNMPMPPPPPPAPPAKPPAVPPAPPVQPPAAPPAAPQPPPPAPPPPPIIP